MAYSVKLDIFEGPMDLLLYLIRKNEIDVYDIPMATITEQYLSYLELLKNLNLNVAGEFILMASTLVHIKSKMLLPIPEEGEEEEAGADPRAELVERLIEYRRFKEAAMDLSERNLLGRDLFTRGEAASCDEGDDGEEALVDLSVFDLIEALQEILKKVPSDYRVDIEAERFRMADKINLIMETLGGSSGGGVAFTALFPLGGSRAEVIVTFLAVLELCKLLTIRVHQTEDGVIRVYLPPDGGAQREIPVPGVAKGGNGTLH